MKKLLQSFLLVNILLLFVNCSSDDSSSNNETVLSYFEEPFYEVEAPQSTIISKYGDVYTTESNGFSLGYKMKYESEQDGVINYYFSLYSDETLHETEVLFYGGKDNVDFLVNFLNDNYEFDSEVTNLGLTVVNYYDENKRVELSYFSESYSGVTLIYGKKLSQ